MTRNKKIFLTYLGVLVICGLACLGYGINLKLKKDLKETQGLSIVLEKANRNLNTNLKNSTQELNRSFQGLKLLQKELSSIEANQVLPLREKIAGLEQGIKKKDKTISELKGAFRSLKFNHRALLSRSQTLEKNLLAMQSLVAEKKSFAEKSDRLSKAASEDDPYLNTLEESIDELNSALSEKENRIGLLSSELSKLNSQKSALEKKSAQQQRNLGELNTINEYLKKQLVRFSQKLAQKNQELLSQKKETEKLSHQLRKFQVKIDNLENELLEAHVEEAKASPTTESWDTEAKKIPLAFNPSPEVNGSSVSAQDLEALKSNLQTRLNEIQLELIQKTQSLDALEKNLALLNQQLVKKDQEKTSFREQITRQQTQFEKLISLNTELNSRFAQISRDLSEKESELEKKDSQISLLKEQAQDLQLRLAAIENESTQKQPDGQGEAQRKAEELKRKIEVILNIKNKR